MRETWSTSRSRASNARISWIAGTFFKSRWNSWRASSTPRSPSFQGRDAESTSDRSMSPRTGSILPATSWACALWIAAIRATFSWNAATISIAPPMARNAVRSPASTTQ
jgi:hypothetical protein